MPRTASNTNLATLVAAFMLPSCITINPPPSNISKIHQNNGVAYSAQVIPFENYDPPKAEKKISLPERLFQLATCSISPYTEDHVAQKEVRIIADYLAFRERTYALAEQNGYSKEKLQTCSPRQAIEAVCTVLARKTNYFGRSTDYEIKKERRERFTAIETLVSKVLEKEQTKAEIKEAAKKTKFLVALLRRGYEVLDKVETNLANTGAILTAEYDTLPISHIRLLEENCGIVCRHFARLAEAMMFVLQQDNAGLSNTYVSCCFGEVSTGGYHLWNQVLTVDQDTITVSFFDPTTFDGLNELATDHWHFTDLSIPQKKIEAILQEMKETPRLASVK